MDHFTHVEATNGMTMNWGASPAEITGSMAGDDLIANPALNATRSISISSPPEQVFPWLKQMGFGRAGWYSYDLLDNLGRRSADRINPAWQDLNSGDIVPGGPINFTALIVEPPHTLVLVLGSPTRTPRRIDFTLSYRLDRVAETTRLVTRVRSQIRAPGGRLIAHRLLGPGDGFMLRRQLRTLKARAELTTG